MAIVKVIEILAQSEKSWNEAARVALEEAAKTIKNIQSLYIKEMQAIVENNTITQYRINAKISFVVDDARRDETWGQGLVLDAQLGIALPTALNFSFGADE